MNTPINQLYVIFLQIIHQLTGINPEYLNMNFDQFLKHCKQKQNQQQYLKRHKAQLQKSGISFDSQEIDRQLQENEEKAMMQKQFQEYEKSLKQNENAEMWQQQKHMQEIIKSVQKKLDELRKNMSMYSPQTQLKYRHKKRQEEEHQAEDEKRKSQNPQINPHKNIQKQTFQTSRRNQREFKTYESKRKGQTARQSNQNLKNKNKKNSSILWDEDE